MAFPILPWFQRQMTVERIDQHFARHSYRMILGLEVSPNFSQLRAALLLTAGRGKYLRATHSIGDQSAIPEILAAELRLLNSENTSQTRPPIDGGSLYYDLAECQASLVQRLKAQAGKYVDRILAVSVMDPGIWTRDFDGRLFYRSACDAVRLAELTGMNVIDGYPQADLYAGGNAFPLAGLPLWLQFSDRSTPCAKATTLVVDLTDDLECWGLPGSDGADDWLPNISWRRCQASVQSFNESSPRAHTDLRLERMVRETITFALELKQRVEPQLPVGQVIVIGPREVVDTAVERLRSEWPNDLGAAVWLVANSTRQQGSPAPSTALIDHPGLVSGLLGMLHIDQIPANLPHLTGASGLRVLGRLTPGRLSAWRHLLVNMTDTQSPIMRLKDAI